MGSYIRSKLRNLAIPGVLLFAVAGAAGCSSTNKASTPSDAAKGGGEVGGQGDGAAGIGEVGTTSGGDARDNRGGADGPDSAKGATVDAAGTVEADTGTSEGSDVPVVATDAPASGAGDSGGTMVCAPGLQVECACMGGTKGVQACKNDGSGYAPCLCPDADAGTGGKDGSASADLVDAPNTNANDAPMAGAGGTGGTAGTGGSTSAGGTTAASSSSSTAVVDCGPLTNPANGSVNAPATTFGSTATYSCVTGYGPSGSSTRVCQANGTWSGTTPTCVIADCPALPGPDGGTVYAPTLTYGSTATYSCLTGYNLTGSASRSCQADGTWTGTAPTCVPVDCGALSSPGNGSVSTPATTYGATATYSCTTTGYTLSGGATRACQASGTWSGTAPTCVLVDCGPLPVLANGTVNAPTTTYSSTATYSCTTTGYLLSGGATRTCQANGTWSGTAPTCALADCGALTAPAHGTVNAPTTTYGSTAGYSCTTAGYALSGAATRVCQANGTWTGTAPTCVPRSCAGLVASCGPSNNENCCTSLPVPGGTFNRNNGANLPATVGDFYLDKYEVTVARFRAFVSAGQGTQANPPAAGAGVHPLIAGTGWDSTWNSHLAADSASLRTGLQCNATYQTWTNTDGTNERRPMNCLTWYEAFAFCAWDGGRLPTEAEWEFASAGGGEQRKYPWGGIDPGTDATLAVYGCYYNGTGTCSGVTNIARVGSVSAGNSRWGQSDLAGNIAEWAFDYYASSYVVPCNNCANTTVASQRVARGGNFGSTTVDLSSCDRSYGDPGSRDFALGVRCARTSL